MSHIVDAEMFAEEIMIFVMTETSTLRKSSRNLRPCCSSSLVTSSIQFAVRRCLEENEEAVQNIFNALLDAGDLNAHFSHYSKMMSVLVSLRGFRDQEFVQFCGVLCRLAVLGHAHSFKNCLTHAVAAIVDAVKFYRATGAFSRESWAKMSRAVLFKHV